MGNGPTKEEKQIAEIAEKVDSFSAGWATFGNQARRFCLIWINVAS